MFTDKEIAAYRNIKAPIDLCKKITNPKKKQRKVLYFSSAIAACFILVISGFVIMNNQSNIVINGQDLKDSVVVYDTSKTVGRNISSVTSIPIEIKVSDNTKVVVSDGFISVNGSNPSNEIVLSTSETIWWEIDLNNPDNVFEMRISDKKGVEKITLIYENQKITASKEKLK